MTKQVTPSMPVLKTNVGHRVLKMRRLFVPQCYSHCFQGREEVIADHWKMESHRGVTEPGLNIQRKNMVKEARNSSIEMYH